MTDERGAGVGTWVGFSAMTLGMFMAVLDIQIVVTSLPEISEALAIARVSIDMRAGCSGIHCLSGGILAAASRRSRRSFAHACTVARRA